ncbi:MAG: hypothetical protein V1743_01965 [Nanoarchaeota archaeon]
MNIYYDKEGDYLEIHMGKYADGYFKNLGKGVFLRVDNKTKKTTGVAIMGFKKRTDGLKEARVSLPVDIQIQ